MRLILFDIDGTLLDCGPQVRPLFASALVEVFGTAGDVRRATTSPAGPIRASCST